MKVWFSIHLTWFGFFGNPGGGLTCISGHLHNILVFSNIILLIKQLLIILLVTPRDLCRFMVHLAQHRQSDAKELLNECVSHAPPDGRLFHLLIYARILQPVSVSLSFGCVVAMAITRTVRGRGNPLICVSLCLSMFDCVAIFTTYYAMMAGGPRFTRDISVSIWKPKSIWTIIIIIIYSRKCINMYTRAQNNIIRNVSCHREHKYAEWHSCSRRERRSDSRRFPLRTFRRVFYLCRPAIAPMPQRSHILWPYNRPARAKNEYYLFIHVYTNLSMSFLTILEWIEMGPGMIVSSDVAGKAAERVTETIRFFGLSHRHLTKRLAVAGGQKQWTSRQQMRNSLSLWEQGVL